MRVTTRRDGLKKWKIISLPSASPSPSACARALVAAQALGVKNNLSSYLNNNGHLLTFQHKADVDFATFSSDGKKLVIRSRDQTVKIWDVATGQELFTFKGHTGDVNSVAFSPDGKRLAVARTYGAGSVGPDRKSTRLNSSHLGISYAVFCLK